MKKESTVEYEKLPTSIKLIVGQRSIIQAIADARFGGNFSMALREILKTGMTVFQESIRKEKKTKQKSDGRSSQRESA